jgi:hypothetical protein
MRLVVVMVLAELMVAVPVARAAGSEDSAEGNKVAARAEWKLDHPPGAFIGRSLLGRNPCK